MMQNKEKVLLTFLPFWTPYIPPQGITVLKNFLVHNGYNTTIRDLNVDKSLRRYYLRYFQLLEEYIPNNKKGNFVNVGHDVMLNHMMAHINYKNEGLYYNLVKKIIYKTYYTRPSRDEIRTLVNVLDEFYILLKQKLEKLLEEEQPTVWGATAYSGTLPAIVFAARIIKKGYPNIKIYIGGGSFSDQLVEGTDNFNRLLELVPEFDRIIIGPGQIPFLHLLEGKIPEVKRVVTSKDVGGKKLEVNAGWDIPDLDEINQLDYLYTGFTGSRSCPYECSFCNVKNFWGKHVLKSSGQLFKEIEYLYNLNKNQLFFAYDALLNNHIDQMSDIIFKSDLSVYYVGYLRVSEEAGNIENSMRWRQGGFYRARLGVESGSQNVLNIMNKGITVEQIKKTISALAHVGIKTTVYIVIGHPGETEEDFQQTLDLIEELKDDIWEAECNPFNYYYSNQNCNDKWASKRMLLYPEEYSDMLIMQTWTLDIEPRRKVVYERMNKFVQHCQNLNIPNPYTINEIYEADLRWKKLHKNAVPLEVDLRDPNKYIDECKSVKEVVFASNNMVSNLDFSF